MSDKVSRYRYAYLVAQVRKEDRKVISASIFSSEAAGITQDSFRYHLVDVTSTWGDSFSDARDRILKLVFSDPHYEWLRPLLGDRDRKGIAT